MQLQRPCANVMKRSLRFKKDVLILKILPCFEFCAFGFEAIPYPSWISLSLWTKLTMGKLLLLFLCNFCSFFRYAGGVLVRTLEFRLGGNPRLLIIHFLSPSLTLFSTHSTLPAFPFIPNSPFIDSCASRQQ